MRPRFTANILVLSGLLVLCLNPALSQTRTLRVAFHVFQDDLGENNFNRDSVNDILFLAALADWMNQKLGNLDTLYPPVPSSYVKDAGVRIRVDSVYYHRDNRAWDCSIEIDAPYMRQQYVDHDTAMTYLDKHQTLPVFIGGNYPVVGGHSKNIGDKGYIGMRGFYAQYLQLPFNEAIEECARNLLHEVGHCLGLLHNFRGGPGGDQCDLCEDNGCPVEGSSNNLMDYWPNYGHALSECQVAIIFSYLKGEKGTISDVLINDSCYIVSGLQYRIEPGESLDVTDTLFLHGDLMIENGGKLRVTGYLSIPADRSVFLLPGSALEVDGGTIGNLCGDLWEGIRVSGSVGSGRPSVVIRNGGSVENARRALNLTAPTDLSVNGGVFRNNIRSLILNYPDTGHVIIDGTQFTISRLINHYEEGCRPLSFIDSEGLSNLEVTDCQFRNEPGSFLFHADSSGTGIIFRGHSLTGLNNDFENLYTGILAGCQNDLILTRNRFIHNRCAVDSKSSGYQLFENNTIVMQRFNDVPTYGLVLDKPDGFRIVNNRFESKYGGGEMAGAFIIAPSTTTSLIADNVWSNLPLANLVLHPPEIEQNLVNWVLSGAGTLESLRLGPQFRNNRYDSIGVSLLIMPDSLHGTGFGHPAEVSLHSGISVSDWPHGGYAWYNEQVPLIALGEPDQECQSVPEHGFYLFMNSEMIQPVRDQTPDEIRNNLSLLVSVVQDPASFFTDDVHSALSSLDPFPALARSGFVARLLERYSPEESTWLRKSLAEMAGRYTVADSSLITLGTMLASMPNSSLEVEDSLVRRSSNRLPAYPGGSFFRFLAPADFVRPIPGFELRPNPSGAFVNVVPLSDFVPDETWRYELFSVNGQKLAGGRIPGWQELKISTGDLSDGVYFLRIFGSKRNLGTQRFINISQ